MASGCTHEVASFVSSDDLDNISISLDGDNDLEEEITHLFNEVSIFIFKFEKKPQNQSGSKYTQSMYRVIRGNFERFQVCFLVLQQHGLVWKHNFLN